MPSGGRSPNTEQAAVSIWHVGAAPVHHNSQTEEGFMISIIRAMTKLSMAVAALAAFLSTAPSHAEEAFIYISATGSNVGACTAANPCAVISTALTFIGAPVRVICLNGSAEDNGSARFAPPPSNGLVDFDCPQGNIANLAFGGGNFRARIRHLSFRNAATGATQLGFEGSGTLILEDCTFEDSDDAALIIAPNGPLNVAIRNSRMSNGVSGILLKPAAGGSINATLDHVTIADNNGGGIKIDTTNGPVTLDVTDSVVSNNGGNGINAIGNVGGQAIVSIKNSVIAKNGAAGVQANGANAGVLIQTTLLDENVAGATSVVNGGNMSTYGNNSLVGPPGSGFNHTAGLQ
jgi:hypothetical protein